MLKNIGKIKAIGSFKEFPIANDTSLNFEKFNIIFGNNGNGKTTFTQILASLNENNPKLILQKKRLNCTNTPHSIISFENRDTFIFQDGIWKNKGVIFTSKLNKFIIFNDDYIKKNFFDEIFEHNHKVNLHRIIFGVKGVELNSKIKKTLDNRENIKNDLGFRTLEDVKKYLDLTEDKLAETKQKFENNDQIIKLIQSQDEIKRKSNFSEINKIFFEFESFVLNHNYGTVTTINVIFLCYNKEK